MSTAAAPESMHVELIDGPVTLAGITRDVADAFGEKPTRLWRLGMLVSVALLTVGVVSVTYLFMVGVGTWGLNTTVGWAFDITDFVFWVGIGHAGTLISAVLYLFRQRWRNAVNRSAEAMTLFAVLCASIYPVIHVGRPWLALWMLPYPNTRGPLWINFSSPLVWDFFAISTYFTVSLLFWYVGLLPDLATIRDRTRSPRARAIYGFFALGWNGSHRVWHHYESLYMLLAGLATPLVLSVHTVVSWDFGVSIVPGWHSTIFPPYFVNGAILSGLAMVLTLLLVTRKVMRFEAYITSRHIDAICYLIIVTGGIISLSYGIEVFVAMYSGNPYEQLVAVNRGVGNLAWAYWLMIFCNVVVPQLLWSKWVRRNVVLLFILTLFINVGMWFERFNIIVTSLERSFLEPTWANYAPTIVEIGIFVGSFGLFMTGFLLFARALPMISIAEVKALVSKDGHHHAGYTPGMPDPRIGAAVADGLEYVEYSSEETLTDGALLAKHAGRRIVDIHTPYPVHGLSKILDLPRSRVPLFGLMGGVFGAVFLTVMIFWIATVDWPLNIGGKPWNSLPAYIPPIFEATILWAVFAAFGALLVMGKMNPMKRRNALLARATNDRFVLVLNERAS
jgi:Ni/Fe-hydrogenase subunit HybB-like protein